MPFDVPSKNKAIIARRNLESNRFSTIFISLCSLYNKMDFIMDTVSKIRTLLKQKGIAGYRMCSDIGLSNATFSQWNTGKTKPTEKNLKFFLEIVKAINFRSAKLVFNKVSHDPLSSLPVKPICLWA